jgi:hypothetical protein
MSVGCRRNAAVIGSLALLCSLVFADWTELTPGTAADLYSVHFPEGAEVGYAVGVSPEGGGVALKTTDGGSTWEPQDPGAEGSLNSVYFKDNNNGFAVGDVGTALVTTDGGATWNTMTVPGGTDNSLTYVRFPANGQVGYIGVHPRTMAAKAFKTTDGGSGWTEITVGFPLSWSRSCAFATEDVGVVVGDGGFVVGTQDGLGSHQVQGPLTIADLVAAAFSPDDANKGYLIGNDTMKGVIRYTATFGDPLWETVRCPVVAGFYGVDMPTADVAYVVGAGGFIGRSIYPTDFWTTTVPLGLTATMYGVCFPTGADTGYAVGGGSTILKTTDGGQPWLPGVAEGKAPAVRQAGIRVVSNPCRRGIALLSDADVNVAVFDAAGRAVMRQAATKGLNFLSVPTGAYFVKAGAQTARVVVTD